MWLTAKLLVLAALLYGLVLWLAAAIQRQLMYVPDRTRTAPASVGLRDVDEIVLETPDGARVLSWYAAARPGRPTILYFHGNGGSLVTRTERIAKYMSRGLGVFMMTYRGYGGSTGTPSERAIISDAKFAYDRLVTLGVEPDEIVLYGESLGSGVATQLAAVREAAGLILDAPYTSMLDLARLHYPLLPARFLMTDRYETARYIGAVRAPILIIHGEEDDVIPVAMAHELIARATAPKKLVTYDGAGHSDHYRYGSYDDVYAFIDGLASKPRETPRRAEQ